MENKFDIVPRHVKRRHTSNVHVFVDGNSHGQIMNLYLHLTHQLSDVAFGLDAQSSQSTFFSFQLLRMVIKVDHLLCQKFLSS